MYTFFQNLNERGSRLFWFRGSLKKTWNHWLQCEYELSSGPNCSFRITIADEPVLSLSLGFLFGVVYLKIPFFSFEKWIKGKKETGFYFHDWAFVGFWFKEPMGGSPQIYFHIDDFFLGKRECLRDEGPKIENVEFELGGKKFVMNSIAWERRRSFRRFIPYALFHRAWWSVEMKIDKPPLHAGKGENSWDCDDDGSFGLYGPWQSEAPTWKNVREAAQKAVEYYVSDVLKYCKKYGSSNHPEQGVNSKSEFKYVGPRPRPSNESEAVEACPS